MNRLEPFKQFAPKSEKYSERKNAIIYTRVSTKEQAETNTSLETQKKLCEQYAKNNNYIVKAYFGGTYESAKSDDRKEFKRMLKFAKQSSTVGYIIVYSYDRFSRTGSSASQITSELLEAGIQVKAVSQDVNTLTASGKFQQNLFYIFSQFDNELRKDKTITAMSDLLRKGYWLWTPPLGYINSNKHQRAVDWKIDITEEGKLLKKAFKWKADGFYSNTEIVSKLAKLGLNTNEKRIHEIFKNPFYCGILVCKMLPGEVIEANHQKIVSTEDFLKINNIKSIHPKKHIQGVAELPLKQFTYCAKCRTSLTGFLVKQKGKYYYKCRTRDCSGTKSAEQLHEKFKNKLTQLQVDNTYHETIKEVMINTYDSQTAEIRNSIIYTKKQITEIKQKLGKLEERFAIGEIEKDIYIKFSKKFNEEIYQLEEENKNPFISSSNLNKAIDKALKMSTKLNEIWDSGDLEQKRKLQQLVFPSGMGYNKQIDEVQTKRVNTIFSSIPLIATDLARQKSGEPVKINQFSARVTSSGFKPETS